MSTRSAASHDGFRHHQLPVDTSIMCNMCNSAAAWLLVVNCVAQNENQSYHKQASVRDDKPAHSSP